MLKVVYKLKLGQDEFELHADVKDEKEFFETLSFYSNLPRIAPGGSDDLKISFRTTKKGHKYYSLVSEKEKKEFKLGQNLDSNGGGLFPSGWDDLYSKDGDQDVPQTSTPTLGQTASAPITAIKVPTLGQTALGRVTTPVPSIVPPKAITPSAVLPANPAANPNVAAVASNVLARFGINK